MICQRGRKQDKNLLTTNQCIICIICDSEKSTFSIEKRYICSLVYFGCFGSEITNSLALFPSIFCYFLWSVFNYGVDQERCHSRERFITIYSFRGPISAAHSKLSNMFVLSTKQQRHFFVTYQATGSLRNDPQTSIFCGTLEWKMSNRKRLRCKYTLAFQQVAGRAFS